MYFDFFFFFEHQQKVIAKTFSFPGEKVRVKRGQFHRDAVLLKLPQIIRQQGPISHTTSSISIKLRVVAALDFS